MSSMLGCCCSCNCYTGLAPSSFTTLSYHNGDIQKAHKTTTKTYPFTNLHSKTLKKKLSLFQRASNLESLTLEDVKDSMVEEISKAMEDETNWETTLGKLMGPMDLTQKQKVAEVVLNYHQNDGHRALKFYNWMNSLNGFAHSCDSSITLIQILVAAKNFDEVYSLLNNIRGKCEVPVDILETLIRALGAEGKVNEALQVFDFVKKLHPKMPVSSYNAILEVVVEYKKIKKAEFIFLDMLHQDIYPDDDTLRSMVRCMCDKREMESAVSYLDKMERPLEGDFNKVIQVFCKLGRSNEAIGVFDKMPERGCIPSTVCYNNLINGLCLAGKSEEALARLEIMKGTPNSPPDIFTYTSLMTHFWKQMRFDVARLLYNEAVSNGLTATPVTYYILIAMACKEERIDEALKLFDEMQANGLVPNKSSFVILIPECLKRSEFVPWGLSLYHQMVEHGIVCDFKLLKLLLWGACKSGLTQEVRMLLKEMRDRKFSPDDTVCCAVIYAHVGAGESDQAYGFLVEFMDLGFCPRTPTYNVLLRGFCKAEKFDEAVQLLSFMSDKGTSPDETTYKILASELSRAGRSAEASRYLEASTK